jgi:Integrase zinc binding domain
LVELHLLTDFMDEKVLCGVIPKLPDGVDFLLGNDIWAYSHPSDTEESYEAVVTRSQTAVARSFETKSSSTLSSISEPHSDPRNQSVVSPKETRHHDIPQVHYGELELTSVKSSLDFKVLQEQDTSISALKAIAESEPFPVSHSYYYLRDGILFHHAVCTKKKPEVDQLVVPTALRNKVLYLAHDIPAAGHLGVAKTQARLWPHFYWPHMDREVGEYCKSCDKCQRLGKGPKPPVVPLIPLQFFTDPFSRIAIDIVGSLPVCPKTGNRFILTVLDLATHYPEAIALPDFTRP